MEKAAEYILCFKAGVLDEPKYTFNPRKQIKQKEQVEINNLKADYISKLIMSGVITGKDAIRAISEDNFKFDWIDIEDYKVPENPEVENEIFNQWQISQDEKSLVSSEEFTSETALIKKSMDGFFIQAKIDSLNSIDFSKDNELPNLNQDTLEQYGFEDKPVVLKKEVIDKNKRDHSDIDEALSKRIIGNGLYRPEAILKGNKDKPDYYNFISRTDDNHSDIVLVELSDKKENYEIINYHIIKNRQRKQKERRDKNLRENS